MKKKSSPSQTASIVCLIGGVIAWSAVVLQFYLMLNNRVFSIPETVTRFFSYFTILTNILVATCYTSLSLNRNTPGTGFFSRVRTVTAIAVYITIVGFVYNLVLRQVWEPKGLQKIVDELLHSANPIVFAVYWFFFVSKKELQWTDSLRWLGFPFVYLLWVLARGAYSGFYPYYFIDVTTLGYTHVLLNSGIMLMVFMLVSLLYLAVARTRAGREFTQ